MFESALSEKFKLIFDMKKVSYDEPGDMHEQECLFVQIDKCTSSIKDGSAVAKVEGTGFVFAQHEKMPFGYFSKAIRNADSDLKRDLVFFEIEQNTRLINNIVRRSFGFVYFFSGQYDPDLGTITSVETEVNFD